MPIGMSLIGFAAFVTHALAPALNAYALLYFLVCVVLPPVIWFVVCQAFAAIIGHYALKLSVGRRREALDALRAANGKLQEQNRRLLAANALLLAEQAGLKRKNRQLFSRARRAELRRAASLAREPEEAGEIRVQH